MRKTLPVLYFQFCQGVREILQVSAPLTDLQSPINVGSSTFERHNIRCIWKSENKLPQTETLGSAGLDLPNNETEDITIEPGEMATFSTGLTVEVPEGIVLDVRSRSGLAFKHGVHIPHGIGTVDSDYRGEVKVILVNHGKEAYTVKPGDRIAQLVFLPYLPVTLKPVEKLSETSRGVGGFGSTGT